MKKFFFPSNNHLVYTESALFEFQEIIPLVFLHPPLLPFLLSPQGPIASD